MTNFILGTSLILKTNQKIDKHKMTDAPAYSRNNPLERMYQDVRMFTIGGGTAQILRTVAASQVLKRKLPQTRNGYLNH